MSPKLTADDRTIGPDRTRPATRDDPDAATYYVDDIQQNPEVCANCFRKLRDVVIPHSPKKSVRAGLVRYYVPKDDRVETAKHPAEAPSRNPPNACSGCGAIRGATKRPLSTDDAVQYARHLSDTLADLGVQHDPITLIAVVAHRKRFPRYATRDDDTFHVAVDYARDGSDYTIADVLSTGATDPGRLERVDQPDTPRHRGREDATFQPVHARDYPALPAPDPDDADDRHRRAYHGRPTLYTTDDELDRADDEGDRE